MMVVNMRSQADIPVAICIAVLLATFFEVCNAVELKFTNLKCESFNESVVIIRLCRLKVVRRGVVSLNTRSDIIGSINNITVNLSLYKKSSGYKPFLYNIKIDFCEFKRKRASNGFALIIYKIVAEFSDINHTCPYKGQFVVKDLILDENKFRLLPLPSGEYLVKIASYFSGMLTLNTDVFFYRKE